jgi:hypothetical protein
MLNRNWPAICQMSRQDQLLMILIATIDLESAYGKRLAREFSEFYSEKPVQGPIPLSVLRHESFEKYNQECPGQARDDRLYSYDVLTAHDIPHLGFDTYGKNAAGGDFPPLPENISADAKLGSVVDYKGAKWVIVENNDSCIDVNA